MVGTVIHAVVQFVDTTTFADNVSNSFTFNAPSAPLNTTLITALTSPLTNFYNTIPTGGSNALCKYISQEVSRASNASKITWYDVSASLGGHLSAPISITQFTLAGGAGTGNLPTGCAICVGFRSLYGTDPEHGLSGSLPTGDAAQDQGAPPTHTGIVRPRARDRGRIYIGPLDENCNAAASNAAIASGTVSTLAKTDIGLSLKTLAAAVSSATPSSTLQVWSRRAAAVKDVGYYYVDEGITYQRRREDDTVNRVHQWALISP